MNVRGYACCALFVGLAACSSGGDDGATGGAPPPATTTTTTTSTTSLVLVVEGPQPKAGIELRVKAEVDSKPDGITGTTLAVSGARATAQAPTGWTSAKGDVTVVTSADKKTQLAATSFAGSVESKLAAAATSLGLTACEWNPGDSMTIGKSLLAGTGADGVCTRGPAKVKMAYVATTSEGLLLVGAWEDGGDAANVFGSMRSIVKVAGGAGNDGIAACCNALRQNANSAPADQKGPMIQAAAICDGLRNSPQGKQALGAIRGMLKAASMPSACK